MATAHAYERHFTIQLDLIDRIRSLLGIGDEPLTDRFGCEDTLGMAAYEAARAAMGTDDPHEAIAGAGFYAGPYAECLALADGGGVACMRAPVAGSKMGLAVAEGSDALCTSRKVDEMTAADVLHAVALTRRTQNGPYQLVHYNLIASYADPWLDGDGWDAYDAYLTEVRGTVFDMRDGSIASLPFYKFRNMDECPAYSEAAVRAAIEDAGGRMLATEKLDGSMIQMRYIAGEDRDGGAFGGGILYTTSNTIAGSPAAASNSHIEAVSSLFLGEGSPHARLVRSHPDRTFVFEMIRPDKDMHVVPYPEDRWGLWLIGARDVSTGLLDDHGMLEGYADEVGIRCAPVLFRDLGEAIAFKHSGDGSEMEGMVIDIDGWLVKLKLDDFLERSNIFHMADGGRGFRSLLSMIHRNVIDDALAGAPAQASAMIRAIAERAAALQSGMEDAIAQIMAEGPDPDVDRRAFAVWVNSEADCPAAWKGYLFATAYKGGCGCFYQKASGGYVGRAEFEAMEDALAGWRARRG
jgi:hypothetical protein